MFEVKVQSSFDAAHFLEGTNTRCDNFHGHTWNVWVILSSEELHPKGWVINFTLVKKWLNDVLKDFDHNVLNYYLDQPTAENLCFVVFRHIHLKLWWYNYYKKMNVNLVKVEIAETSDNIAVYSCSNLNVGNISRSHARRKLRESGQWEKIQRKKSESLRGHKVTKKTREKIRIANRKLMKKLWQDPNFSEQRLKAIFKGFKLGPNKPEKQLNKLLQKLFLDQWKYVGDGKFWINRANPDFMNIKGQKKLIELFGDYWHSEKVQGISKEQHSQERIDHFAKCGYQTLIIWEHELKDLKSLKERILEFMARTGV